MLGPERALSIRTYVNFLDTSLGKGLYLTFLCLLLLEKTDRNETTFVYMVLVVAIFNIVLGYKDSIKELPIIPWPHLVKSDAEMRREQRLKSSDKNERMK